MNKRGFIRILEVMFAITILAISILYLYSSTGPKESGLDEFIENYQKEILNGISVNETLRGYVLENKESELIDSIYLPENLNFTIEICNMTDVAKACNMDDNLFLTLRDKEIYVAETMIVADLAEYDPKKVKLFIWEVEI